MKTVAQLFDGILERDLWAAHAQREITGVFDDSRQVMPGSAFVSLKGVALDGRRFIDDARQHGASLVIGEDLAPQPGLVTLSVPDARAALGRLAARWYELDSASRTEFKLLGVTGTNGKSTTTHMVREIMRAAGKRCGMLGTVQYDLCCRSVVADMTTPGPLTLAGYLRECAAAGAHAAVMEVSSHALDQKRTEGLRFAGAAFTNLTRDHLDYHQTLESYADAKARLFDGLDSDSQAIVNADDPAHTRMIRDCKARVLTFSIRGPADITAQLTRDSIGGTLYRMRINGRDLVLENALVGKHNVYNALTAAGLALAAGLTPDEISAGLALVRNIPGRLQRVPCMRGVDVFVDYAHTDDALRNVLSVLRPLTRGRLIVVFGCGGDRDRSKRPLMARAAAEYAHAIIVTSDNPRTEDPNAIIAEIMNGFDESSRRRVIVEPDRRAAIFAALAGTSPGDVVLLAGKGHEDYQIIGRHKVHFDDVEVALQSAAKVESIKVVA